jgi:hypothetical protein
MPWISSNSSEGYYSQRIEYEKLTNGTRNQLNETVYLSVSDNIKDVIPNIVAGSSANKQSLMWNKIVISYFKPFPFLLSDAAETGTAVGYIDDLYQNFGVRDAAFIIKNWNQGQFDNHYPCTWPPDNFTNPNGYGIPIPPTVGGLSGLTQVINTLKNRNYWFALHENYVDLFDHNDHMNGIGVHNYGRLPYPSNDSARTLYDIKFGHQAHLLKLDAVGGTAGTITNAIKNNLATIGIPNFSYLDVSSSINPSGAIVTAHQLHGIDAELPLTTSRPWSYVDFSSGGKMKTTIVTYRNLAGTVRTNYNGPVQGEGGYHFLYAGYYDDFEGRLQTGSDSSGYKAPLILEFSKKIREKSAVHGVGHIQWFFDPQTPGGKNNLSEKEIKIFMATELAYGHAALVQAAPGGVGSATDLIVSRKHAQWSQQYLRWVQQLLATATITNVKYYSEIGEVGDASAYIKKYPNEYNILDSFHFMGRIKVEYSNGMQIFVNRTKYSWQVYGPPVSTGFYCYNLLTYGMGIISYGNPPTTSPELPDESGWYCYSPIAPIFSKATNDNSKSETETPRVFEIAQNYPNPFNPLTNISYSIPEISNVKIIVIDILGRVIETLIDEVHQPGNYKVSFNANRLASGVYFYRIQAGNFIQTKKMVLMK